MTACLQGFVWCGPTSGRGYCSDPCRRQAQHPSQPTERFTRATVAAWLRWYASRMGEGYEKAQIKLCDAADWIEEGLVEIDLAAGNLDAFMRKEGV